MFLLISGGTLLLQLCSPTSIHLPGTIRTVSTEARRRVRLQTEDLIIDFHISTAMSACAWFTTDSIDNDLKLCNTSAKSLIFVFPNSGFKLNWASP